ncbi:MAG: hypothetical protein MRJ68_05540 [Nitrospira sp.]|nr:hypothetical protein [Nitrospira sp.]
MNFSDAVAKADAQDNAVGLSCLTDRPTIVVGENARLLAVVATQDGTPLAQPVSFEWKVKDGTVQEGGSDVEWSLSGVKIGDGQSHKRVTATGKATVPGNGELSCSVEVFIIKKPDDTRGTRSGLIAGRRYLLPEDAEDPKYGLYSYLLMSSRPQNEKERERYLKTLEAYLQVLDNLNDLDVYVRRENLNATYIPLTKKPTYSENNQDFAKNVLDVYHFARAKALLSKFKNTYDQGPYLISVKLPLTKVSETVSTYGLQDFAGVDPELAASGVKNFEYLVAQQRTWTEQSIKMLPFMVRSLISSFGRVVIP